MSWITEEQQDGLKLCFKIRKKIVSKKSKFQKIDIVDSITHGRILTLDDKIMLTERDEFVYHEMITHVPLFSSKKAENVLIIGGGDGGTARECLKHSYLKNVDLCEIDGDVISLSKKYLPFTASIFTNKKLKVYVEDGFIFLKNLKGEKKYDVIVVDSMDPVGMAAVLFGDKFFQLAKSVLKPGGIICTQCESPFFYSAAITTIHKIFTKNFKHSAHYTAPVTTYPSGYWSFAIASDTPLKFNQSLYRCYSSKIKRKFYNDKVHSGCFALPNFFIELLKNRGKI